MGGAQLSKEGDELNWREREKIWKNLVRRLFIVVFCISAAS
jgi:hypothetical protein